PSSELDTRLVGAFRQQHAGRAPQRSWWRSLFVGSVSVPKPALAALALILAVMLVGTIELGKSFLYAAASKCVGDAECAAACSAASVPAGRGAHEARGSPCRPCAGCDADCLQRAHTAQR